MLGLSRDMFGSQDRYPEDGMSIAEQEARRGISYGNSSPRRWEPTKEDIEEKTKPMVKLGRLITDNPTKYRNALKEERIKLQKEIGDLKGILAFYTDPNNKSAVDFAIKTNKYNLKLTENIKEGNYVRSYGMTEYRTKTVERSDDKKWFSVSRNKWLQRLQKQHSEKLRSNLEPALEKYTVYFLDPDNKNDVCIVYPDITKDIPNVVAEPVTGVIRNDGSFKFSGNFTPSEWKRGQYQMYKIKIVLTRDEEQAENDAYWTAYNDKINELVQQEQERLEGRTKLSIFRSTKAPPQSNSVSQAPTNTSSPPKKSFFSSIFGSKPKPITSKIPVTGGRRSRKPHQKGKKSKTIKRRR